MAWTESHQSLGDHPKTLKAARLLGISTVQLVGHLHYLWWWALDYAPEGDVSRFDALDLAVGARWEGDADEFVDALTNVGFLEHTAEQTLIHDWGDYGGKLVRRKEANASRMRQARAHEKPAQPRHKSERATHVRNTSQNVRSQRREEERREEDTGDTPHSPLSAQAPPSSPASAKNQPFELLTTLCEEVGQDISVLSEPEKRKQLAAGKRLAAAGVSPEDVKRMVHWLAEQAWVTGGIDLFLLEKQLGKWQLAGKPDHPPPRASPAPNGVTNRIDPEKYKNGNYLKVRGG
jgi:hypothetical protein